MTDITKEEKDLNVTEQKNQLDDIFKIEGKNPPMIANSCSPTIVRGKLIDKIIEKGYCTKYPIYITVCIIFGFISNGIVMNVFNLIILPTQDFFNSSDLELEILAGSLFIGVALGSGLASVISSRFGRAKAIKFCYGIMFIFHLILPFWLNIPIFIISRIILGITVGIAEPLIFNSFGEFLPSKIRGFFLMNSWFFCTFAVLLQNIIALKIMPYLESDKLRQYLFLLSIFSGIAFIINFFMLNDSPRFLFVKSNYSKTKEEKDKILNEALRILNKMNKISLTEEERIILIEESKITLTQNPSKPKLKELFYYKFLKTTIIGTFVFFVFACGYNGFYIISTLTLEKLNKKENDDFDRNDKNSRNGIIKNQIYIALFDLLGSIVGGSLAEVKCIGRKGVIWIFMLLSSITLIPSAYGVTLFNIFFTLSITLAAVYGDMLVTYFSEIFPTKLRDLSSSYFLTTNRISGFISQFLFLGLFKINLKVPYYFGSILCIIGLFTIFLLPYEARGKPLDSDLVDNKKIEENN